MNDIKQSLDACRKCKCPKCAYFYYEDCNERLINDAYQLIEELEGLNQKEMSE